MKNMVWVLVTPGSRLGSYLGLSMSLCLWLSACALLNSRAPDEDRLLGPLELESWVAKAKWLQADIRWHRGAISESAKDTQRRSLEAYHQRQLQQQEEALEALIKNFNDASVKLRQAKQYRMARQVEAEMRTWVLSQPMRPNHKDKLKDGKTDTAGSSVTVVQRETLLGELSDHLAAKNFVKVKGLIDTLTRSPYKQQKPDVRIERAQASLQQEVASLDQLAAQAYRLGKVEEAIQLWQQALEYDPQNATIEQKLERAQRVAEKLEAIRSSN